MEQIVEDNKGLVHWVARRYRVNESDYDDLIQEGYMGLMRAAETFNSDKGAFSSYAVQWIRSKMSRYIKYHIAKYQEETSLNRPVGAEEEAELMELIESGEDLQGELVSRTVGGELIHEIKRLLSAEEYEVFMLSQLFNYSVKEISKTRDIEEKAVTNSINRARSKIRRSEYFRQIYLDEHTSFYRSIDYRNPGSGNSTRTNYSHVEALVMQRESMSRGAYSGR